jgi:seryl-tRNA synthetase
MKIQTENKAFQRDVHSKALLLRDSKQADDYKLKSKLLRQAKSRDEEINNLKTDVSNLNNEINTVNSKLDEITNLLKGIVGK